MQSLVFLLSCISCCIAHRPLRQSDSSHLFSLGLSSSALQGIARPNIDEDGFAPRKVVTQATHQRRAADEQAGRETCYRQVANGNSFTPLAEDTERDAKGVKEFPLAA